MEFNPLPFASESRAMHFVTTRMALLLAAYVQQFDGTQSSEMLAMFTKGLSTPFISFMNR